MTLLVLGKSGQVAQELQRQADVIALGRNDCDLMLPGQARAAIQDLAPIAVINAAAYTAVDKAEDDLEAAERLNAEAPSEMALICAERDIPFLHISTDYVFDGAGQAPWREDDSTAPINAYGRTKHAGEVAVRAAGGRHVILRTSWVFSAHGTNFLKTMLRLSETRSALSVVADQIGGPTPARDIAAAVLIMARGLQNGHGGGTYHFSGQPSVSWAAFAREIFAQDGQQVLVSDIPTSDYPTPAKRPLNSRLDCTKIKAEFGISAPDWKAGVATVLKDLERFL